MLTAILPHQRRRRRRPWLVACASRRTAVLSDPEATLGLDDATTAGEVRDAQQAECPASEPGGEEPHRGGVDRSAVPTGLKQHELDAAERLASRGHRVVFIPVTRKGKVADLMIDDELSVRVIRGSKEMDWRFDSDE